MSERKSAQDRRKEVLHATLDLAFEAGPDRLTTGMIAERLGVTQPALYKYFTSKDGIWQTVADSLCARIAHNITAAVSSARDPDIRLRQLVLDHLRLVQDHPALPQIMVMRDPSEAQRRSVSQIKAGVAGLQDAVTAAIRDMIAGGRFRSDLDADDATTLILGILQGLALRLLLTHDAENLLNDGERLLDLQLSLFAAR